jgi:hypothetical protein
MTTPQQGLLSRERLEAAFAVYDPAAIRGHIQALEAQAAAMRAAWKSYANCMHDTSAPGPFACNSCHNAMVDSHRAALTPAPATERNQCDGCAAGKPTDERGFHVMAESGGGWRDSMLCQASKYAPATETECGGAGWLHERTCTKCKPATETEDNCEECGHGYGAHWTSSARACDAHPCKCTGYMPKPAPDLHRDCVPREKYDATVLRMTKLLIESGAP